MNLPADLPDHAIDPGPVAEHLPCRQCGYDLITQPTQGQCPECGDAVSETLRLWRLDSNPRVLASNLQLALSRWTRSLTITGLFVPAFLFLIVPVAGALGDLPLLESVGPFAVGLLIFVVVTCEYTLWAAGFHAIRRQRPHLAALHVAWNLAIATAASALLTALLLFLVAIIDEVTAFHLVAVGVALTQTLRIASIVLVWPHVFTPLVALRKSKQIRTLKLTAGMALIACTVVGLGHALMMMPGLFLGLGMPLGIFGMIAVFPTALLTAGALNFTAHSLKQTLRDLQDPPSQIASPPTPQPGPSPH